MKVLYFCDGEQSGVFDWSELSENFATSGVYGVQGRYASGSKRHYCKPEWILEGLQCYGWYEGTHEGGPFLILNFDKIAELEGEILKLIPTP